MAKLGARLATFEPSLPVAAFVGLLAGGLLMFAVLALVQALTG